MHDFFKDLIIVPFLIILIFLIIYGFKEGSFKSVVGDIWYGENNKINNYGEDIKEY